MANEYGALPHKGKPKRLENATISIANVTWNALGPDPGLRHEKTATNRFSYVA
jgi:hypothetical protein